MRMKILALCTLLFALCVTGAFAADEKFLSCGPGYILNTKSKVDGINQAECQKLWCRDLEAGRTMGDGKDAAAGYKTTGGPVELCDSKNNCIECFGDRKWCAGETNGIWNPAFGAYTRGGGDSTAYTSYLKGSCYAWRLEKPSCASGETAVLKNDEWVCATASGTSTGARESSVRRTGTIRGLIR